MRGLAWFVFALALAPCGYVHAQNPSALDPTQNQLNTPSPFNLASHWPHFCKRNSSYSVAPEKAIPPDPILWNWHADTPIEHAIEILSIKFDWTAGDANDAMNIHWRKKGDLLHEGDGKGIGEYFPLPGLARPCIAEDGTFLGMSLGNNEPVLYKALVQPKIKIAMKAAHHGGVQVWQELHKCEIRLTVHHVDGNANMAQAMRVNPTTVYWQNGLTKTMNPDGTWSSGDEVILTCAASIPDNVDFTKFWYELEARDFRDVNNDVLQHVPADQWTRVDTTNRIDVYSVLSTPAYQWYQGGAASTEPWVAALAFVLYSANTRGSRDTVTGDLTRFLHSDNGGFKLRYETENGAPKYIRMGQLPNGLVVPKPNTDGFRFMLREYILATEQQVVCCYDQAAALATLLNLCDAASLGAQYSYHEKFGYIPVTKLVGGVQSNNPLHTGTFQIKDRATGQVVWSKPYDINPVVGSDMLCVDSDTDNDLDRSFFINHAWVKTASEACDACAGPFVLTSETSYFNLVRDRSTQEELQIANPITGATNTGVFFDDLTTTTRKLVVFFIDTD